MFCILPKLIHPKRGWIKRLLETRGHRSRGYYLVHLRSMGSSAIRSSWKGRQLGRMHVVPGHKKTLPGRCLRMVSRMVLQNRRISFPKWTRYYCTLVLLILSHNLYSQCGPNMDFETGLFSGWTGSTGLCVVVNCDTFPPTPGIVLPSSLYPGYQGRHAITSGNSVDPTCGAIPEVCPWGGQYSMRLGNTDTNFETEDIKYTYTVSAANPIIVYSYAVILQDPNHPDSVQPAFKTYMKDSAGSIIPCSYYKVNASNMRGHQSCYWWGSQVWYRNWTNVAIDMSQYAGQQITLYFQTNDCGWGAHFGMAYVDVIGCYPKQLSLPPCNTELPFTVSAPPGFQSYIWSTGQTGQTIVVNQQLSSISCQVTSFQGCRYTLSTSANIIRPSLSMISHN